MKNIFIGDNDVTEYVHVAYELLMTRKWVSALDVAAANEHLTPLQFEKKHGQLSNFHARKAVRSALKKVSETLNEGWEKDTVKAEGNNRTLRYIYEGKEDDPLRDMINASAVKDLNYYYRFCQDSAGFIPTVWFEHFFGRTLDLFEIKHKRKKHLDIIGTSANRELTNIDLLPFIYECIRDKKVLEIEYNESFVNTVTLIFHPHYMKEYNNRWQIFGHAEGREPREGYGVSLDRIKKDSIKVLQQTKYVESKVVKYPEYFEDIVGTRHEPEEKFHSDIRIKIYGKRLFGYVTSKKIHHSLETTMPYDETLGYGEIKLSLRPNDEFYGYVLHYGEGLEILSPQEVRDEIARRIEEMHKRYKKREEINGSE